MLQALDENRALRADLEEARLLLLDAKCVLNDDLDRIGAIPLETVAALADRIDQFVDGKGEVARAREVTKTLLAYEQEARTVTAALDRALAHGGLVDVGDSVRMARRFVDKVGKVEREEHDGA